MSVKESQIAYIEKVLWQSLVNPQRHEHLSSEKILIGLQQHRPKRFFSGKEKEALKEEIQKARRRLKARWLTAEKTIQVLGGKLNLDPGMIHRWIALGYMDLDGSVNLAFEDLQVLMFEFEYAKRPGFNQKEIDFEERPLFLKKYL